MAPIVTAGTTLFSAAFLDSAIKARPVDDDKFEIPNYVLKP